jgi:hypothetical protein
MLKPIKNFKYPLLIVWIVRNYLVFPNVLVLPPPSLVVTVLVIEFKPVLLWFEMPT